MEVSASTGERARRLLAPIVIAVLVLAAIIYWLRPSTRRKAPLAASDPEPESTEVMVTPMIVPASAPPSLAQAPSPSTSATVYSGGPRVLLASDPDPIPSVRYPGVNGKDFDPFEPGYLGRDPVRTLAMVGVVRVGVPKSATVRDEKAVTQILTDLATEIDAKEKGQTGDSHQRAIDYNPLMVEYGERLRPFMSGSFAFHAERWALYGVVPGDASGDAGP
jgi:hypothetical protein